LSDALRGVLSNWIGQAIGPTGQLEPGIDPSDWVAARFLAWFHSEAGGLIGDAVIAAHRARAELERLGGWQNPDLGEAMHELIHIDEALDALKGVLGIEEEQ
jgi:hypothetical protein